jgi:PAS domain S-box-containing protein
MKIRSQFIISLAVFGIILVVTVASVIFTSQQTAHLSAQKDQAATIQQGASNLNYLSNYYFLYQENLQLDQWHSAFNSLSDDVSSLKLNNPAQQTLVNTLDGDLQNLHSVFESVVFYLQNAPRNVSVRIDPQFQTQWIRLALQNQVIAVDASQLSQAITNQADQLGLMSTALTFILFGTFGIYFLAIYLLIYRRALNSISNLQAETKIIGEGNLDHRIKIERHDEVGELSQAFNQMTGNLKTVTASKLDLEQAQAALRESEQRWAATLASIGDAVIATDLSGRVAFMNGVAEELTGWNLNEATLKPIKEIFNIINEQTRQEVEDPVRKVLEKGTVVGLANHTVLIRKDKTEVAIDDSGAPIKDKDGNDTGVVLVFRDITERKKNEEKISQQALMIANANDAIIGYDLGLRVTFWNKAAEQMYGYTSEEATGKASTDLLKPQYVNITRDQLIDRLAKTGHLETESIRFAKDGRKLDVEAHVILLRDEAGKSIGYVSADRDITQRKQMQVKLEEYAKNLENLVEERTKKLEFTSLYARNLIEASLDPLVTISKEGKITDVNVATEEATGCTREELIGSDFSDYFTEPEQARAGYQKVFTEGYVKDYPLAIRHKTGKVTYVMYNASIYLNPAGEIDGIFAAARDITELRKAEEQEQETAKKLKDAERLAAIGATAGMVGHDIRNPLQAIIGDVYLAKGDVDSLKEGDEKESLQESLTAIEKNTEYINKIVADLQDFARPLKPHVEPANLNQIVNDILAKNRIPSNVELKVKIAKDTQTLTTDQAYLSRMLGNLIANAVQAMPEGGKLTINATTKNSNTIITVKDTGVGIPDETKPKLFTPLFTTKSKGQGFGLAVVKRMTEALNGTITLESQQGKGTTFTITLPQKP